MAFFRAPAGMPPPGRQPILQLPPFVQAWLLVSIAIHLVRLALPVQTDDWVIVTFGFIPIRYTIPEFFTWGAGVAPLTHMLLHGSWVHLLVNMATLMAFGSGVERRIGGRRTFWFALTCGLAGAVAHYFVYPESPVPVVGASGAISGLFGGVLRLVQAHRLAGGSRGLWAAAAVWIGINVLFGLTGMPGAEEEIAWVAHLGGFLAGLVLFRPFDPRAPRPSA